MRVYLAGPIAGCSDSECKTWRETLKAFYQEFTWVDPLRRDFRGQAGVHAAEIVEGDKQDIDSCDKVLAFCREPSVGTSMEILYAWNKGIPVVSVVPAGKPISPWIHYHSVYTTRLLPMAVRALSRP